MSTITTLSHSDDLDLIHIELSANSPAEILQPLLAIAEGGFARRGIHKSIVQATIRVAGNTIVQHLFIAFDPSFTTVAVAPAIRSAAIK
jgi:hypothetical protein